jgi:hypothetical protein
MNGTVPGAGGSQPLYFLHVPTCRAPTSPSRQLSPPGRLAEATRPVAPGRRGTALGTGVLGERCSTTGWESVTPFGSLMPAEREERVTLPVHQRRRSESARGGGGVRRRSKFHSRPAGRARLRRTAAPGSCRPTHATRQYPAGQPAATRRPARHGHRHRDPWHRADVEQPLGGFQQAPSLTEGRRR